MPVIPHPLGPYGRKYHSQYDEDGIIDALVKAVRPVKFFAEIGAHQSEANCLYLQKSGWRGVFIDAAGDGVVVKKHRVTPQNVSVILARYATPRDLGVLSIDVDGQDIYIWRAVEHQPAIVVIEYNPFLPIDKSVAVPEDESYRWDETQWYGASLLALYRVSAWKDYILVHAGCQNAFFVRGNIVSNPQDFNYEEIYAAAPRPPTDFMGHRFVEIKR